MALTILVVDDNVTMCGVLNAVLRRAGYQVLIARDAQVALEFLRDRQPDLLITDLELPVVSGLELVRLVRQSPEPLGSLPTIVLTAWDRPESQAAAEALGCVAFLTKPVANAVLLQTLSDVLGTAAQR